MYERRDHEHGLGAESKQRTGVSPALIAFGIVAIVAVIFIVQNSERANVNFLFFDRSVRVWVAILIAMVIGAVLDRVLVSWWRRRRGKRDET